VRAEFDFRQVSTVERKFDDDAKALESRTVQAENIGGDVSPRRQPGWGIALPGMNSGDYIRRFDNGKSSGNIQFTEQYKVSQIEKTIQEPSARLRALTCAVMIDSAALEKAGVADKSAAEGVQARSQREIDKDLASLTGLVNNAVGSPAHRDDVMFSVTVESMPFARSPEPAEAAPLADPERQEFIRLAVVWGVTGLLGILAVFFIARPLTQALSAALAPRPALGPSAAGESPGLEDAEEALRIPQGDRGRRMLQRAESEAADRRIEEILQKDPAKAAAMIRKWLEEN
jgi:flagellar biosynthesis/type III secretory pathway M-ring protein FliF/YscJ